MGNTTKYLLSNATVTIKNAILLVALVTCKRHVYTYQFAFQVSTVASWFESRLGPFCVEFALSPHLCMGFLRTYQFTPTAPKHAGVYPTSHLMT